MLKKIIIKVFSLLIFHSILYADEKNILISGNERISKETIKVYGDINLKKNIDEKEINKILKNLYDTNFFEDVKVNFSENTLKIFVKEYPIINQLILIGVESNKFRDELLKIIQLKEKGSFVKSFVSKDVDNIKMFYSMSSKIILRKILLF